MNMAAKRSSGLLRTFVGMLVTLIVSSGFAAETGPHKVIDGVDVYYGVLPAAMVLEHLEEHSGAPSSESSHQLVVALFDAQTKARIGEAQVRARVEQPGHLEVSEKKLEAMAIAGTITYGNYFEMSGKGPFLITVRLRTPSLPQEVEVIFEYRHF